MKQLLLPLTLGLFLPAHATELTLREDTGARYLRTFESTSRLELTDTSFLMDGEDMGGDGEMEMTQVQTDRRYLKVEDTVVSASEGVASVFEREYVEIENSTALEVEFPMEEPFHEEGQLESDLEGLIVRFTAEDEDFRAAFADGSSGSEELLEGLEASLSLGTLLPEDSVAPEDSWSIDVAWLSSLHAFGGNLHLELDGASERQLFLDVEEDHDYEGEIEATYLEDREVDGLKMAALRLTVEAGTTLDLTDQMLEMEVPEDLPDDAFLPEIDSLVVDMEIEGEGLVLWNLEAGCLHSLQLELDVTRTETTLMSMPEEMGGGEAEQTMVMDGITKYAFTCEP